MHHGAHDGSIEVVTGAMFSGKSEELLRRVRRALIARRRVQVFTAVLDDRFAGTVRIGAHDGADLEARPVRTARQLRDLVNPETDVVAVDDVHFLGADLVTVAGWLAERRVRVLLAGIDLDFRGEPFGPIGDLMAVAERVDKLEAICARCGRPGTRSQRLVEGEPAPAEGPILLVGGVGRYEARCRGCHEVPEAGRFQTELDIATEARAWAYRARYW